MGPCPPLDTGDIQEASQWQSTSSVTPSHAHATANHGLQHDQAFDIHDTGTTRHGYEAQNDAAGPSRLQGKSSGKGKGKGKETGKSKVKPLKKVHKCTFQGCDKTFITPAHVRRHLRTHTGLQPYQCEFCEKRFARSDVRNRHMQLSHRELHDAWLQSQPPPDRQRQGSKSAGQERESVDRAGGGDGEDYGEIEDDDNDEGAMDAEEGGTTDTRHGAEDLVSFTIPGFLMDVDDTSNRPHAQTTTDTHISSIRHAQSHSTHLQHHGIDPEPSRRESLSHCAPHTQTNTGGNYGERQHGTLQHQSMSDTRPPQAQASFAISDTGLPLDLPHGENHMAGASYDPGQERYRHSADGPFVRSASELSRYAISGQHYSQHGPGPRNDVHGSFADAGRRDDSYAMFAEPQRTMGGARDNEEMLSRLDILLAAAAQPEDSATRGALAVANDDTSLPAGIHHQNNSQLVGTFVAANDISIVGNMDPTTSVPALPFPQNNPNSTITPEAFIASTMGLNPGTVPSVISGASPFDLYDVDLDMGLYHDVFGWGLGAADWQQLAATGQGTGDAGAWTYDMLDLSILNLPTEAVGKIGNSSGAGGPFADAAVNEMHGQSSTAVPQEQEAYNLEPGKQGSANAVPSMRASGRTTRHGTATPGNEEDTPWPHVFRPPALMFERLLALPYTIEISDDETTPFLSSSDTDRHQITPASRASILLLLKVCHSESPWREPDYTHFPSPRVLSHCVRLYFNHFHPILPIMRTSAYQDVQGPHSSSLAKTGQKEIPTSTMPRLDRDDAYYTLRTLTLAAIGATYAEDRLKPLGGYLMELARRIGSYLQLGDPRSIFSIPFIQSRLLIAVGGFADGSRERYLMSEISKGLLITAARRLHLLRERPARQRVSRHRTAESHLAKERLLDRQPTSKEIKKMWREWLEEEERIRLGWAIYIFDAQAAAFLNVPAAFNLNEIQIRLPDAEELWNISNATMWEESYRSRKGTIEQPPRSSHFGTILSTMLREGRLQERVSDFGRWILAHGLYRMCDDANMQNKLLGYTEPTFPPLAESFTRPNQKNPFQLIGSLVTSWQSEVSFARPSTFFASSNVLRHYSSIRFIHPTFMDHVKSAAGRLSAAESREESQRWLTETPPDSVLRRIFVESIHLAVFLLHSRLDAPWEPVILLDCALALWAILRFRPEMLQICASSPGATVLRSGSRSTDYLENWISNGGPLRIQGMSYSMTPDNVLSDFITRLQSSPWGLSNLYAAVLNNLQSKDEVKP